MRETKRWHCDKCHNEWDGCCPICSNCLEIGYEIPKLKSDDYEWVEDINDLINGEDNG